MRRLRGLIAAAAASVLLAACGGISVSGPANGYYAVAFGYKDGKPFAELGLGHVQDKAKCEAGAKQAEAALLAGAPAGAGITVVCVPVPDGPDAVAKPAQPSGAAPQGDSEGDGSYRPSFNT